MYLQIFECIVINSASHSQSSFNSLFSIKHYMNVLWIIQPIEKGKQERKGKLVDCDMYLCSWCLQAGCQQVSKDVSLVEGQECMFMHETSNHAYSFSPLYNEETFIHSVVAQLWIMYPHMTNLFYSRMVIASSPSLGKTFVRYFIYKNCLSLKCIHVLLRT